MSSSSTLNAFVHTMRHEAEGIISIELRPDLGGEPFPPFEAGSHIDLHLSNGLVRSYSLLHLPTDRNCYVIGVLNDRKSRGGSRYVHEQLRIGARLPISVPRNNFALDESAVHSVLLAGGIGVTPMLSMLQRLTSLGKPVDFIYCARSRSEAAFVERIETIAAAGDVRLTSHFDDEQGRAPNLETLLAGRTAASHLYCCGPGPMLDAFERACEKLGYPNTHIEHFAAAPVNAQATPAAEAAQGYRVELRRSGKMLEVPVGKSLLDTLLDAGVSHDYSCREGVCGACETKVLAGEVDHRDSILTKAEREANKSMMVCVSGCKRGPLVLDI
jgi:tetrachlorobenzoquinone reductase